MADINIGAISEILNTKMDLDGNNVVASAGASFRNTSNWSNNMTNCITYIPQDINLELNNGALTLKAGSKIYVPNGPGVFDEVVVESDLTTTSSVNTQIILFYKSDGTLGATTLAGVTSGASQPAGNGYWYDTTNNIIKRITSDAVESSGHSFPFAIVNCNSTQISSVDQVFNGFGYIGSTVFALPGVKGLISNSRNADGSLKSVKFANDSVKIRTIPNGDFQLLFDGTDINYAYSSDNIYNEKENIIDYMGNGVIIGRCVVVNNKITSLTSKTVFHAVDYSDFKPVQDHSVIEFQAPTSANNYMWYRKYADGWVEQGGLFTNSAKLTQITFPVVMADTNYSALSNLQYGSSGWSATVTTCIADGTRTTTGLQILCYYNSSYNTGLICWEVKGMAA